MRICIAAAVDNRIHGKRRKKKRNAKISKNEIVSIWGIRKVEAVSLVSRMLGYVTKNLQIFGRKNEDRNKK